MASYNLINGRYSESNIYADSALAYEPYHTEAFLIKMRSQSILQDTLGLINTINEALSHSYEKSRIYLEAGLLFSNRQLYDSALFYLRSVLSTDPIPAETDDRAFTYTGPTGPQLSKRTKGQAAYQLGYIYGIKNDLLESIEYSNLAISFDSALADAYVNLINGYRLFGKSDSARKILSIALDRFPDHRTIRAISTVIK
jgi:tetratricopeptide (TPR) repeat protein